MKQITSCVLLFTLTWSNALLADDTDSSRKIGKALDEKIKTQNVMLRTRDGYYLRAILGGGASVVADIREPKSSEVFTMEWVSSSAIRLRTRDGFYVGARLGGGDIVDATVKQPLTSEVFTLEWQNKDQTQFRLRTREGFYVHPVGGGGREVDARIKTPKTSEVFTLISAP